MSGCNLLLQPLRYGQLQKMSQNVSGKRKKPTIIFKCTLQHYKYELKQKLIQKATFLNYNECKSLFISSNTISLFTDIIIVDL